MKTLRPWRLPASASLPNACVKSGMSTGIDMHLPPRWLPESASWMLPAAKATDPICWPGWRRKSLAWIFPPRLLDAGFQRVLKPEGLLLISSPDKRNYSDIAGFRNEFHVRELYREELQELLHQHFPHVRLYAQKLLFQSALWSLDGQGSGCRVSSLDADGSGLVDGMTSAPLYYVAACSRQPLAPELVRRSSGIGVFPLQWGGSQEHEQRNPHRRARGRGSKAA